MNRVHVRDFRRADDAVNPQITVRRGGLADANGFIGQLNVHGIGVRFRINGDGADVQFFAGADDPNGDLPDWRPEFFQTWAFSESKQV